MTRVAGGAGVAALCLAVAVSLAAVVTAVVVGPVTFAPDSLLDRFRPFGTSTRDPAAGPEPTDAVLERPVVAEPAAGIPVEVVLSLAVTLVCAALLVRALLRAPGGGEELEEPGPELPEDGTVASDDVDLPALQEAARRGLLRLADVGEGEAADVVVACWVELELAGDAAGRGRRRTETPTEFTDRLRAALPGLDATALTALRTVYSRVRHGRGGARADDVAVARASLADLLEAMEPLLDRAAAPGGPT